jgi:hypothetical protein
VKDKGDLKLNREPSILFKILIVICAIGGMCLTFLAMAYSSGMRSFGSPTPTPILETIFFLAVFLGFVSMPLAVGTKNRILGHMATLLTAPAMFLALVLPVVLFGFIPWYIWYYDYVTKRKFHVVFMLIPLVLVGVFFAFKS